MALSGPEVGQSGSAGKALPRAARHGLRPVRLVDPNRLPQQRLGRRATVVPRNADRRGDDGSEAVRLPRRGQPPRRQAIIGRKPLVKPLDSCRVFLMGEDAGCARARLKPRQ